MWGSATQCRVKLFGIEECDVFLETCLNFPDTVKRVKETHSYLMLRQKTFCEDVAEVRRLSSVKSVTLKRDNVQEERPVPLERTAPGVSWGVETIP